MLEKSLPASRDAVSIVAAFWKSTTGETLNEEELLRGQFEQDGLGTKAKGWGEKFWITHTLVNLINCTNAQEAKTLLNSTPWIKTREKSIKDPLDFCMSGTAAGFGRFVAMPRLVFLRDHNRLLDRNMLLMLKDVLVARYCSCISVWKDGKGKCGENLIRGRCHSLGCRERWIPDTEDA
jgi:hypothetical protein